MVLRALLVAGAKSFTHMITALERYCLVLQTLLAQAGAEVCWPSNSVPACNGIHVQACSKKSLAALLLGMKRQAKLHVVQKDWECPYRVVRQTVATVPLTPLVRHQGGALFAL